MLSKTIKIGFSLLVASLLLAGCQSSNQVEENQQTQTGSSSTPPPTTQPVAQPQPTQSTPPPQQVPALETTVYFDFDKSSLRPETRSLLIAHARLLINQPQSIVLEGHADERGTREYNIALGERRALAVRDFLRSEGVTSPIEVVSYGEERPANPASNEVAWQQNRRVEVIK